LLWPPGTIWPNSPTNGIIQAKSLALSTIAYASSRGHLAGSFADPLREIWIRLEVDHKDDRFCATVATAGNL